MQASSRRRLHKPQSVYKNTMLNGSVKLLPIREVEEVHKSHAYMIAGRTGPGYCYRLYTSAVYSNIFQKYNSVEILETPLQ